MMYSSYEQTLRLMCYILNETKKDELKTLRDGPTLFILPDCFALGIVLMGLPNKVDLGSGFT